MSAQLIFDHVRLGAIIRYSDGTPRPPERHRRKLRAWESRNNTGRLVRKRAGTRVGETTIPAAITLHEGDFGSKAVIVLRVFKTFSVDSDLAFTVVERPAIGSVLVLDRPGDEAVLREVTIDEAAADQVEGRAA